jgi:two-component system response regulator YesN
MTLLIADDEELIRFTIKDMIKDLGLDFDRIYEAANGTQLTSLCREHRPDIALVDIRMPGKSGLEAIRELKGVKDLPTQWIILTGHADFNYAREAVRLGADDYLLKPPSPDELGNTLSLAMDRSVAGRRKRNTDFERRLMAVFNNTSAPAYDPLFSEKGVWSGVVLCLDSTLSQKEALRIQRSYAGSLRSEFLSRLPSSCRGALTTLDDGKLLISIFIQNSGEGDRELVPAPPGERALSFRRIPLEKQKNFKGYLEELDRTSAVLPLRFLSSGEALPESSGGDADRLRFCLKLEEMILRAGASRKEEMDSLVQELSEMDVPFPAEQQKALKDQLSCLFPTAAGENYRDILQALKALSPAEQGDRHSVLVQQTLRILRDRFQEDIGIAQIADTLQVTPNYLSSLFRKHTGTPFTRYITELRINRSRQLLKETSLNIKEVATEVGYHSSRHFSFLFRQETGMSPTEYIKRYRV